MILAAACATGCADPEGFEPRVTGGDPARGRELVVRIGCGACHRIPGIPAARGTVGPRLAGFRQRVYIAGSHPNTPQYLVRWIVDPPSLAPATAMPAMGVSEHEARDIAAYLYTLK